MKSALRVTQKILPFILIIVMLVNFAQANEERQPTDVSQYYSLTTVSSGNAHDSIFLELDLDSGIVQATLVYYNLSYIPKEYEITSQVSDNSVSFTIPDAHTSMPGIEYYFIFETKDGQQLKTQVYSELFSFNYDDEEEYSTMSTATHMWWDIEFRNGIAPCGLNISHRRATAKLPIRTSPLPPVTSKSMEIRNTTEKFHRGIDFGAPKGTTVYNIFDSSKVANIKDDGSVGYGKHVIVEYERGTYPYYVIYAHLDSFNPNLSIGQNINSNTIIGYVGNTGNSTGDHLHMEFYYWDSARKNLYPGRYFMQATSSYNSLRDFDVIQTPYRVESPGGVTSVRVHANSAQSPSGDVMQLAYRRQGTTTWTTASMTKINTTTHLWEYTFPTQLNGSTVEYYIHLRKTINGEHRWVFRPAYWAYAGYFDHPNPYGSYYTCYVGVIYPNSIGEDI